MSHPLIKHQGSFHLRWRKICLCSQELLWIIAALVISLFYCLLIYWHSYSSYLANNWQWISSPHGWRQHHVLLERTADRVQPVPEHLPYQPGIGSTVWDHRPAVHFVFLVILTHPEDALAGQQSLLSVIRPRPLQQKTIKQVFQRLCVNVVTVKHR